MVYQLTLTEEETAKLVNSAISVNSDISGVKTFSVRNDACGSNPPKYV